ncbi:Bbp16 family capsid cement protein [Niveibacterium terrae]|uniref:Bbp16 family capsid cement protein n=1 Tax=Niveibacterium terrae TaxID=3373598 RepID=UPI003A93404E
MGMLDSQLKLATAQAATSVGDTSSTNIYDTGSANSSEIGMTGENLWVQAFVSTAATSGGSATLQAVLQDSADGSTFADVLAGPVVALASLTAGAQLLQVQPPTGTRRYLRVAWRIGTAALTAGAFTAYVSNAIQRNVARQSGFTVQ